MERPKHPDGSGRIRYMNLVSNLTDAHSSPETHSKKILFVSREGLQRLSEFCTSIKCCGLEYVRNLYRPKFRPPGSYICLLSLAATHEVGGCISHHNN
jgi:hypothetical protein